MTTIDLNTLFTDTAKLSELDSYIQKAKELAGEGNDVVLTSAAPVWLYLAVTHALHGKAKKLILRYSRLSLRVYHLRRDFRMKLPYSSTS